MNSKLLRIFVVILIIFVVAFCIFFMKYKELEERKKAVQAFNSEYESYDIDGLNGLDVTTIINKAISNNEKLKVPKDEEGLYDLNDENCIVVYITMIINNETYRMERITNIGMSDFITYFGSVHFNCTNIDYHEENGKVASMTFEATEY